MPRLSQVLLLASAAAPFVFATAFQGAQEQPKCEDVFQDIQVFKGVPANDLIPSMEFMAASLHFECSDCHDPKDYSADTRAKTTARHMILMTRDINAKNFNGRSEVTCNSCHGGKEHPAGTPIPDGISLRHTRMESAPKPEDLIAKYVAAAGSMNAPIVRKGTLTGPNDQTHKVETLPLEFIQASGGKFRMISGERKVMSDGTHTWYGTMEMFDEPAFAFNRLGRAWLGAEVFSGLERTAVSGKDTLGKSTVTVVRGSDAAQNALREFYFDAKTGLLSRVVNIRRSTMGNVVSAVDFTNYKTIDGVKAPMRIVATFAGGQQWIMDFKSAKTDKSITDAAFIPSK